MHALLFLQFKSFHLSVLKMLMEKALLEYHLINMKNKMLCIIHKKKLQLFH